MTIFKNSGMGLFSQLIKIFFTFVTRYFFIKYIGTETLGINSTFSSILGTLSLADLGFQTAVAFRLYKPLSEHDEEKVNAILNVFRTVYTAVGIFFIIATIFLLPFLQFILSDVIIDYNLYLYFILQSFASACSYFIAYKRVLLYADQKDYIAKIIDLSILSILNIVQCVCLAIFRNYYIYLLLKILEVFVSNIIVNSYCHKTYSYLKKGTVDRTIFKEIISDVKNVFAGKMAAYIYNSTDNIIVSTFVSTVAVGRLVNYTTVSTGLKTLCSSVMTPMAPFIGNSIAKDIKNSKRKIFNIYQYTTFLLAILVVVPVYIMLEDFIKWWVGNSMVMSHKILILLMIDLYINIVHGNTCDFINAAGLFKKEKYIDIIGAASNIVVSLLLVKILGIEGVLIGTCFSQMIFWLGRSWIVFFNCLNGSAYDYVVYWCKNILYILIVIISIAVSQSIYKMVSINIFPDSSLSAFFLSGLLIEMFILALVTSVFYYTQEEKALFHIVIKLWRRKVKND